MPAEVLRRAREWERQFAACGLWFRTVRVFIGGVVYEVPTSRPMPGSTY